MASNSAVEKELICPICADYFTQPKGLPCLHTFCRDCIKAHIMTQNHKRQFTCPMCRSVVSAPEEKPRFEWADILPTNHHVVSIMDIVIPNYEPTFCKLCTQRNDRQKAIKHCNTCSEDYCYECSKIHSILNATKSHTLTDLAHCKRGKTETRGAETKSEIEISKADYKISATYKGIVNAKTDRDDDASFITGVIFLEDDRIVAADNSNYKIKLLSSEGKLISEVHQIRPFGLTLMHQTEIAVTEAGCIKFFQIYPNKIKMEKRYNIEWKIYTPHTMQVSNALRGVHYCKGQFVVCSGDDLDKHIAVLDVDGTNKRHIWKDECVRGHVFKDPWYCKFSEDLETIYVTDGAGVSGCLKCLSYNGQPKWEFPCHMPRGMEIIGDHVFVADWREDEIKVLTKDGEFVKTLLTKDDGIRRPQAIAVNLSGDKLIVTNSPPYKSDQMLLFDLEYSKTTEAKTSPTKQQSSTCSLS